MLLCTHTNREDADQRQEGLVNLPHPKLALVQPAQHLLAEIMLKPDWLRTASCLCCITMCDTSSCAFGIGSHVRLPLQNQSASQSWLYVEYCCIQGMYV